MNWLANISLRCLVWTVAIMLPVQPLVAGHCACRHSSVRCAGDAECKDECVNDNQDVCHDADCNCEIDCDSSSGLNISIVEFPPSDCPPTCPCHLRNAPPISVAVQGVKVVRSDVVSLQPVPRSVPSLLSCARRILSCAITADSPSESALELCAALCRFTI